VLEEFDENGVLQAHYDWDDDELLRLALFDEPSNQFEVSQPLADGHNSTRQLTNLSGEVTGEYSFDAYGNSVESVGASANPYRYNTQRLDASGLYYLRARQYAPGTGRFLNHDPAMGDSEDPISLHRYLYAGSDPINFTDPSGNSFLGSTIQAISIGLRISAATALPISVIGYTLGLQSPANAPTSSSDPTYSPQSGADVFKLVVSTEAMSITGGYVLRGALRGLEAAYFSRYVLSAFEDGATIILPKESYEAWIQGRGMVGRPDGQMLLPRIDADKAISASGGNPEEIAKYCGTYFKPGQEMYRLDIDDIFKYNPRPTEPGKAGANDLHRPGYPYETSGGLREVVIDRFPESEVTVSQIIPYR
jgi:RHS repeat-associated protein